MTLYIQDPSDPSGEYLIDRLLGACQGATRGGGAFAFLSAGGAKLFLQDERFIELAKKKHFDLIVGADAITDIAAIAALNTAISLAPSLTARVHIPSKHRSIFHPKIAWFERPGGGILITGSGNLTAGGLRWNIEAFFESTLSSTEVKALVKQWDEYKARSASCLLPTDSPEVTALLERNADQQRLSKKAVAKTALAPSGAGKAKPTVTPEMAGQKEDYLPAVAPATEVLVSEISGSGDRWKQANFHKEIFINFFGASVTIGRTAYLFRVRPDGTLGHQEVRPAVVVKSRNFRFELDAASGIPYPDTGRPIAVFVRIAVRTFIYMLVMPSQGAHAALTQLLQTANPNPGRFMRQIIFSADEVRATWPDSPLWAPLVI